LLLDWLIREALVYVLESFVHTYSYRSFAVTSVSVCMGNLASNFLRKRLETC